MSRFKDLQSLFFPRRASTQTWMMLTFALFVGTAVVLVGLYAFIVLQGQVRDATRETLRGQTRYIATQIETATDREELFDTIRRTSEVTPYRIGVATRDSLVWELQGSRIITERDFLEQPEVQEALRNGFGYDERTRDDGGRMIFSAVYRPTSGYIIRVGQPAPPLLTVISKMQATLVIGLALALVLALIGAWISAIKVTRPLKAISKNARRINAGDLDREIVVRTRAAEVQDLAKSLNLMAERFREDIYELQRVARIQNEFIGNVSHEVKNPIFAVGGYIEALASDDLQPDQRQKYVAKGLTNLQRLNNLFSELIEIAKLEYREDLIRPEAFDLQELIEEIGEMLEPKAEAKGLSLTYHNRPAVVWADRSRIRQVLTNLIDNAIAYTDSGTVRCRMRRHRDKMRVEVVDTGRGIPEDHLDRIFERFYRVDAARSRKQGGTGLGLSIVKQIMQAHGEQAHVESTAGRGTRFWFELPLAESVPENRAAVNNELGDDVELSF
jgi:signal transduction histidine kinase